MTAEEAFRQTLELIAASGGKREEELGVVCDGTWCAEQARTVLHEHRLQPPPPPPSRPTPEVIEECGEATAEYGYCVLKKGHLGPHDWVPF